MNDDLTFEGQMMERGKSVMATDAMTGVAQQYTAHNLLAVRALKVGDEDGFVSHVCHMLEVVIAGFTDYGLPVHPEKQVPLLFLATAVGDFQRADRLAAIAPDAKNSHSFDIALGACLRSVIQAEQPSAFRYKPTASEAGLFSDIAAIGSDGFSTGGTDAYWRATRKKRYARTLFQDRNLFAESLTRIHQRVELGGGGDSAALHVSP